MHALQTNIEARPIGGSPPRILLMEDEATVARGFQMVLTEEGYGVDLATTGQGALDTIGQNGYDLLVADLRLPDMDGMEVIRRVKDARPEIRVIVVTGYADVTSAVEALKAGVHDYLSKPLTEREFITAVTQALGGQPRDHTGRDHFQDAQAGKARYISKQDVIQVLWGSLLQPKPLSSVDFRAEPLPDAMPDDREDQTAAASTWATAVEAPLASPDPLEKKLVENAVEGIMAWDGTGTITVFNKRMETMLGYTKKEAIGGMTFDRFFPVGAAEQFQRDMYNGASGHANTLLMPEADMLHKSGHIVPVQLSATVLFDRGKEIGIVLFARDLQEFRAMEQALADLPQLLHQNKMMSLGRLAASIVHEINNPLSGILNYVRIMLKGLRRRATATPKEKEEEKFLRYLTLVESEVSRCTAIVSNLLAFSRMAKMEFGAVNVPDLLQKCVMLSRHKLEMEHIRLDVQSDPGVPEVLGNFNQIQQCVINLIFNAIDAMEKGDTLTLGCRHDSRDHMIEIRIQDDGCGITKENLFHIFDPFFTTKEEGRGLGLGLSTVYKIIAQHKGTINVESQLGQGTIFTIRLPAVKT